MISNSRQWALARNLLRRNEVHGAEEWRIPVREVYRHRTVKGQSSEMKGTLEVEDCMYGLCVICMCT